MPPKNECPGFAVRRVSGYRNWGRGHQDTPGPNCSLFTLPNSSLFSAPLALPLSERYRVPPAPSLLGTRTTAALLLLDSPSHRHLGVSSWCSVKEWLLIVLFSSSRKLLPSHLPSSSLFLFVFMVLHLFLFFY